LTHPFYILLNRFSSERVLFSSTLFKYSTYYVRWNITESVMYANVSYNDLNIIRYVLDLLIIINKTIITAICCTNVYRIRKTHSALRSNSCFLRVGNDVTCNALSLNLNEALERLSAPYIGRNILNGRYRHPPFLLYVTASATRLRHSRHLDVRSQSLSESELSVSGSRFVPDSISRCLPPPPRHLHSFSSVSATEPGSFYHPRSRGWSNQIPV